MRRSTWVVIGILTTASVLLVSLTVLGKDNSQDTSAEPTQFTSQPVARPNYEYILVFTAPGEYNFTVSFERSVLAIEQTQILAWCGGCPLGFTPLPSGHLYVYPLYGGCVTFRIPEMARSASLGQQYIVSAQLLTNSGILAGEGEAAITDVCQALFWLGEKSRG